MYTNFILIQLLLTLSLVTVAYFTGLLVIRKGIRVNYTRKINHFILFFLPALLHQVFAFELNPAKIAIAYSIGIVSLGVFIHPMRDRFKTIATMFASFDRPEDRPRTLLWLSTQTVGTAVIQIPLMFFLSSIGKFELLYIPVFINGIGDGLAEPVGIRFGKHPYKVKALFTKKIYQRTIEGSLCVFITGIVTILLFSKLFTGNQFIAAIALIPISMTLAEAFSPHTWDSPFLYFTAAVEIIGILHFF